MSIITSFWRSRINIHKQSYAISELWDGYGLYKENTMLTSKKIQDGITDANTHALLGN